MRFRVNAFNRNVTLFIKIMKRSAMKVLRIDSRPPLLLVFLFSPLALTTWDSHALSGLAFTDLNSCDLKALASKARQQRRCLVLKESSLGATHKVQ